MQTETLHPIDAKQYAISQSHQYCAVSRAISNGAPAKAYLHRNNSLVSREYREAFPGSIQTASNHAPGKHEIERLDLISRDALDVP